LLPDPVPHTTLDTYQRQIDHIVDCALTNQESAVISGQQGYQSLLVVDAAYASGRSGKLVEVRP
ncbi:MAG: hypothetical protein HY335_04320, partial [Deinococcus sp.]|nr:hypothetical protein [Deinococcus sp.]